MSDKLIIEASTMAARLRQIDEQARVALALRVRAEEPVVEPAPTAALLIPVPRKARMFIRHGGGHGVFSDVTLTRPARAAHA